ncbi:hypothetical protein [Saccharopolyspora sp. NPDC049357]|uniref:hypothetical protein n=1 Tax=Saccharopolyspora sp. NPDC049357 TaxID=3154507 RepID=UPI00342D43FB
MCSCAVTYGTGIEAPEELEGGCDVDSELADVFFVEDADERPCFDVGCLRPRCADPVLVLAMATTS